MMANPALSQHFQTNDCILCYRCLHHQVSTETMFSNMYLCRNNECSQVFASDFGWVCIYSMKSKGEAHKALSLMFQHEGVMPSMVMDGSTEQTLGKLHQKLVDAPCQLKQTEPYSPWQNATEREIKELKKGSGHNILATSAPR